MRLIDFSRLTGANVFCDQSAVVGFVDVDPACVSKLSLPEFARALEAGYPDLAKCLGSCVDSTNKPLLLGNALSSTAAGLCNLLEEISRPINAGRDSDSGNIFFGATCHDDRVAPHLKLAYDIVSDVVAALAGSKGAGQKFLSHLERFKQHLARQSFGPSGTLVVRSAEKRNIPWFRVRYGQDFQLAQFGWGSNARRMSSTRGPGTAFHACKLSFDKRATAKALARIGLPVPSQRIARTADDAAAAAREIGFPVVVKPKNLSHGRGISVGLTSKKAVRNAFTEANRYGRPVLVETMLPGADYRLLVVNGRLRAATKRVRASVVGDGKSTVRELLDEFNRDPRRKPSKLALLDQVPPDNDDLRQTLQSQGLTIDSVPTNGQITYLRSVSGLHSGATAVDVTEHVHPDNRSAAERASLAIGLDIAGIDFITPDIERSWMELGGGICEVNDLPGLRPHAIADVLGDYGGMVLDAVFAPGDDARIPVVLVMGDASDSVANDIAARLNALGIRTVLLERKGIFVCGGITRNRSPNLAEDVGDCLNDPWAQAAVLALPPEQVKRFGLGLDKATATVLADIGSVEANIIDLIVRASEQVLFLVDGSFRARIANGGLGEALGSSWLKSVDGQGSRSAAMMLSGKDGNCTELPYVGEACSSAQTSIADAMDVLCAAAATIAADDNRSREALKRGFSRWTE